MVKRDDHYYFRIVPDTEKLVVFSGKESKERIQPAFISLNPNNELTTPEDRLDRVCQFKSDLLAANYEDDVWQLLLGYYQVCLNNDLPYSTFDILRSVSFSSELAAKCFLFLVSYDQTENFIDDAHRKMEHDLGFSFHWVAKGHWENAMNWMCNDDMELMRLLFIALKKQYSTLIPINNFNQISGYVLYDQKPAILEGYHLNSRISEMRARIGAKVLKGLPQKCPKIPDHFKQHMLVDTANAPVKILLKSPLAIALSIAGKDETLWCKEYEQIRRNVRYSYQLDPEWYGEAITYCLNKL